MATHKVMALHSTCIRLSIRQGRWGRNLVQGGQRPGAHAATSSRERELQLGTVMFAAIYTRDSSSCSHRGLLGVTNLQALPDA